MRFVTVRDDARRRDFRKANRSVGGERHIDRGRPTITHPVTEAAHPSRGLVAGDPGDVRDTTSRVHGFTCWTLAPRICAARKTTVWSDISTETTRYARPGRLAIPKVPSPSRSPANHQSAALSSTEAFVGTKGSNPLSRSVIGDLALRRRVRPCQDAIARSIWDWRTQLTNARNTFINRTAGAPLTVVTYDCL
jgi:hypothetical protein